MSTAEAVQIIQNHAAGRFEIGTDSSDSMLADLRAMCPDAIKHRDVLRLRRLGVEGAGWRTILIVGKIEFGEIQTVLRWTALVRDALPDPEASDLYLMIFGDGMPDYLARKIELGESFCRRLVLREEESITTFLGRTFLAIDPLPDKGRTTDDLGNPLAITLNQLVQKEILTKDQSINWRRALISMPGGQDLASEIGKAISLPGEVE